MVILRYCPSIRLEGLRKTTKTLSYSSRFLGRDLKPAPPEYEALDHDVRCYYYEFGPWPSLPHSNNLNWKHYFMIFMSFALQTFWATWPSLRREKRVRLSTWAIMLSHSLGIIPLGIWNSSRLLESLKTWRNGKMVHGAGWPLRVQRRSMCWWKQSGLLKALFRTGLSILVHHCERLAFV
jgi:hypothetical protein